MNNNKTLIKRSVGIQSIVPYKERINPKITSSFSLEELDYPKFALVPYSLSSLIITCSIIHALINFNASNPVNNIFSSNYNNNNNSNSNILKTSDNEAKMFNLFFFYFKLLFLFIVIFGISFLPDSIMRRPHPICWRFLFSCALFYQIILLFFATLTIDDARYLLKVFDLDLNKKPEYKSYGDNCDILTNTYPYVDFTEVYKSIDMYVFAHLLGWFVKYLAIRNFWLASFLSIGFEILELTFKHWLPNFNECWWDHLLLDLLGMNLLGIVLGNYIVRLFNMKNYEWLDINLYKRKESYNKYNSKTSIDKDKHLEMKNNNNNNNNNLINKLSQKPVLKWFFPVKVEIYNWDFLSSSKMFFGLLWLVIMILGCDLAHFFIKYVLWLPITHKLLAFRIFMWGFISIMGIREYYDYLTNKDNKRIGMFMWITHVMLFTEWSMIYKFSNGMFEEQFPKDVVYGWSIGFIIFIVLAINVIIKDLIKVLKNKTNSNYKTETKGLITQNSRNSIDIDYIKN